MGPLCLALAVIVDNAEKKRPVDNESLPRVGYGDTTLTLYRGLKLTEEEINEYKSMID